MTKTKTKSKSKTSSFAAAVSAATPLVFCHGLGAVPKKEGRSRIRPQEPKRLLGSAALDDDCKPRYPHAARWDFVVGYGSRSAPHAHFIEVHSAHAAGVAEVEKKLSWLEKTFLRRRESQMLERIPRTIHWVASGPVRIPKNTPQFRRLAKLRGRGPNGPTERLARIHHELATSTTFLVSSRRCARRTCSTERRYASARPTYTSPRIHFGQRHSPPALMIHSG